MKTQHRVNKMLFSNQRVELNLVKDIIKLNSTYYVNTDQANSKIKGLLSEARAVESLIDEAIKSANQLESIISNVEKQANELGVNPFSIDGYEDANAAIKESSEYKQVLATIKKFITSI